MHGCRRCGRCCLEVGRTFWKHVGEIQELNDRALDGDHEDNGLPCEMLEIVGGKAVCTIHRDYGYQAKPTVCREYPLDGEPCFAEEAAL